jgi:CarD family transcriptional regulator
MFEVDDCVVYGNVGVCKITDISRDKYINSSETEYYVLQPVYDSKTTIRVPVDNVKISMRKIITREDVSALIAGMPTQKTIWIDDTKQRIESFKAALKTGRCEEWVMLIKTLYLEKKEKMIAGKKMTATDESIMKTAQKQLYEEFAIALDISPDEVEAYILSRIY